MTSLDQIKANLKKYAQAHPKDWAHYGLVKLQIARAAKTPAEYEELIRFYTKEAQL